MYKKIDELKEPPVVGETYLVPCIIHTEVGFDGANPEWKTDSKGDLYLEPPTQKQVEKFTPIINHPHSDKENGQPEVHYHIDDRFFIQHDEFRENYKRIIRITKQEGEVIKYKPMVYGGNEGMKHSITPTSFINKSKLKHKCIHKGKCPHRGYDLSQEIGVDGVITCPLHGLKFDEITKQLLNSPEN